MALPFFGLSGTGQTTDVTTSVRNKRKKSKNCGFLVKLATNEEKENFGKWKIIFDVWDSSSAVWS